MICDNRMSDYDPVICDHRHVRLRPCHLWWQACQTMTLSYVMTGMSDYDPCHLWWQACQTMTLSYVMTGMSDYDPCHLWQQACQTMTLWSVMTGRSDCEPIICGKTLHIYNTRRQRRQKGSCVQMCSHVYIYTKFIQEKVIRVHIYKESKYHDQHCKMT